MGGGAAGEAGARVPSLRLRRPFPALAGSPGPERAFRRLLRRARLEAQTPKRDGGWASRPSSSSATPILSALPSSASAPNSQCPAPHLPVPPPVLSLSPELPDTLRLVKAPNSASAPQTSQCRAGLPGPLNPFRVPPILLGPPVLSFPGPPAFPSLAKRPNPAVVLTALQSNPGLLALPPFCQYPYSCHPPTPQLSQGSLILCGSSVLLVNLYLARVPEQIRTP